MSFIGIISSKKYYDNMKKELLKMKENVQINIIHINLKSIINIKNIKFETIIIQEGLNKIQSQSNNLRKICDNAKYIFINTDLNKNYKEIKCDNVVTYGLNIEAMVTVSSITDSVVLIYWQKNMKNRLGEKIEIEEKRINLDVENTLKIDEILTIYIISKIYKENIIEQI